MDEIKNECVHNWTLAREEDFGEMDYSSYGGGVEHFVVSLYYCPNCEALKKEYRGDFNGNPSEYLNVSEDDISYVKLLMKPKEKKRLFNFRRK